MEDINIVDKMNSLGGTITIDNNPDKLDDVTLAKVNELRAKRNHYNDLASEVQKEIDQTILEANNFAILKDKYLKITYPSREGVVIYAGPVLEVSRIYSRSCRVLVKKCVESYDDDVRLYVDEEINLSHYDSSFTHTSKTIYEEISENEFNEKLNKVIDNFKKL